MVPSNSDGIGGAVTVEVTGKLCCIQDMLHVGALLEAHEVKRNVLAIGIDEVARTVAVPVSDTKEIPPEEVVSKDFDLQRLPDSLRASGRSGRPTGCWSTGLAPEASSE